MVIDVRKLKYSGKESANFDFDYVLTENLLQVPNACVDGSVKVSGTLQLHSDTAYVDGTISTKIVGKCSRCLEDASQSFSCDFSVTYVRSQPNLWEDEYLYKSGLVDLTQAVNETLLANFPQVLYCKEDCKGLCPVCGNNLNEKDCNCK